MNSLSHFFFFSLYQGLREVYVYMVLLGGLVLSSICSLLLFMF